MGNIQKLYELSAASAPRAPKYSFEYEEQSDFYETRFAQTVIKIALRYSQKYQGALRLVQIAYNSYNFFFALICRSTHTIVIITC